MGGDSENIVIGRGWTQPGGRPHAETEALKRANGSAAGGTAYVTLEPCDHHGQTPPCSESLIAAGIARAVIATRDPDSRVSGKGVARLEAAGIEVLTGICEEEAKRLNAGFFLRITEDRPLFTLKLATTLDGRIATHSGDSRWITGTEARAMAHLLRANHDAIMIGIGTALADDPVLTCRLPGLEGRSPVRIVADSAMRLPVTSRLVTTATETPTWLVVAKGRDNDKRSAYESRDVSVIEATPGHSGRPELRWLAGELSRRGLTRVLVEGGGQLAAEMLKAGLVDELAWFRSPSLIGGDGIPAAAAFGVDALSEAPTFIRSAIMDVGADVLETYFHENQEI